MDKSPDLGARTHLPRCRDPFPSFCTGKRPPTLTHTGRPVPSLAGHLIHAPAHQPPRTVCRLTHHPRIGVARSPAASLTTTGPPHTPSLYGTHSWDAHHPPQATSAATPPFVPAAAPQVSLGPRHFSRPAWRAGRPVSSPAGWPTPLQPSADPPQTGPSPTRAPPPLRHTTPRLTLGTTRPGRPVPDLGQLGCAQT